MPKPQNAAKRAEIAKKAIDTSTGKRGRGRPPKIARSWVTGRAENYRRVLLEVWPKLSDPLLGAETTEQVIAAFEKYAQPYAGEFVPRLASDMLVLIHDPNFPKRPKAQVGFLADSVAGRPNIRFRSSRDICVKERAKQRAKSPYKILRKEFYIECECGYEGPARDNACRECGAAIPISVESLWGNSRLF